MKISKYISPSFEMKLKSYDSENVIEFEGTNNFKTLILTHLLIIGFTAIVLFAFYDFLWQSIWGRGIFLLIIYLGVSFSYNTLKRARNPKYIKESVRFDKNGISLNHSKGAQKEDKVGIESLKNLKLIFDDGIFKFMLYELDKPYFEFSVSQDSRFEPNKFLADFSNLLQLQVKSNAQLGFRNIFEFEEKGEATITITVDEKTTGVEDYGIKSFDTQPEYQPKTFRILKKENELVFEATDERGTLEIIKKMRISKEDRVIWHKRMLVYKETIKFSEIDSFEYQMRQKSEDNRGSFIEGKFYIKTINKKKKNIFTINKDVNKQVELVELEVLKDLAYLKKIVEQEISTPPSPTHSK